MKVCGIHQPTFFPWLGYFDKIKRSDIFVFLDQVDYQKSGGSMSSWCNRVKINIGGKALWISCPVIREHGKQIIQSVKIDNKRQWRADLLNVIESNYKKSINFEGGLKLIKNLLDKETESIADFNIHVIENLARKLGCQTTFIRQSSLPSIHETATDRLIAICKETGADTYLCGAGSGSYLDEGAFEKNSIELIYQNFIPKPYGNTSTFIPGLSVIDFIMNENLL
jgi:hypothetical protein